ncbi:MAG: histone deacetylase family protein [Proteobacteria bacterium]|nr:histone deacetylase family protein [Pseudomonadota bacterium]MBU4371125.1 histone deacetylase family protein [Pseudomonadota bacterium]MCG2741820.1 histone deacetylase family protein [Syntrophaceae bacterium]
MFHIRRIFDDILPRNRQALEQIQDILRSRFMGLSQANITKIPDLLRNPFKYDFRSILYVVEIQATGKVRGFALLSHEPVVRFCYLDYLVTEKETIGRGIGSALYERVREESVLLQAEGLFFECLPDDPALSRNPEILKQNRARLRFYESFGARPIAETDYETPLEPGGDNPPYLVFDGLGKPITLRREDLRQVVKTILEKKYRGVCSKEYVQMVIASIQDDPVRIREPRYFRKQPRTVYPVSGYFGKIALVVNDRHAIHHVHERGYVESPVRIQSILDALEQTNLFSRFPPEEFSEKPLLAVHSSEYVRYFKRVCEKIKPNSSVYPYVFPIRNRAHPPVELAVRAGYYCIDTFTPLGGNAFIAAKRAVDCTLTAAEKIIGGFRIAYSLVRPPGHHAERDVFGGFCYFNNAAIAAHHLSPYGHVAMLDVDYHHGNGQQFIFYKRSDILTVSIHGHPSAAYPYFSGFAHERGEGNGTGFNVNYPLPEQVDAQTYLETLSKALSHIRHFRPRYLVVSLGLDTAKGDPTGSWSLQRKDFNEMGRRIGAENLPTLVVQEGGYRTRTIGINARSFFEGLWQAIFSR